MNFSEKLIELIRDRACLYVISHVDFKNKQIILSACQEISCETKQTGKCLLLSASYFRSVQDTLYGKKIYDICI